jgi:multidrug efflux pump subunit AcrA (membrane-fusion protein)
MISVRIVIEKRNVLTIPRRSIRNTNEGASVDVLDGDTIITVPVELGIISGDLVEVTYGLSDGNIVIIT